MSKQSSRQKGTQNAGVISLKLDPLLEGRARRAAARRFGGTEGAVQSYLRMALTNQLRIDEVEDPAEQTDGDTN